MISEPSWYVTCAAILFAVGLYPILARRNMIQVIIGIEILTSAANLNFLVVGHMIRGNDAADPLGQNVVMASILLGACVATVALLLIINLHKHSKSVDVRELRRLRW